MDCTSKKPVWKRATPEAPCPVCDGTDRCLIAPGAAICRRKRAGGRRVAPGAYLFDLDPHGALWAPWRRTLDTAVKMIGAEP